MLQGRDLLLLGVIALWIILVIRGGYRRRKAGKSLTCGCDCGSCANNCHHKVLKR